VSFCLNPLQNKGCSFWALSFALPSNIFAASLMCCGVGFWFACNIDRVNQVWPHECCTHCMRSSAFLYCMALIQFTDMNIGWMNGCKPGG
jgi:hypothetical protein